MSFPKTTCIARGIDSPFMSTSKTFERQWPSFYGKAKSDPTHFFDDKGFAYLKAHLGEVGFPRNAREAWLMCHRHRTPARLAAE